MSYVCAGCGRTIDATPQDDADAQAEWQSVPGWQDVPESKRALVCEQCWRKIGAWARIRNLPWPTERQ